METYRGTPLSKVDEEKAYSQHYKPEAHYTWDTGVAMGKYLAGLKAGELWGVKCTSCDKIKIPPRMFCEDCFKPISEWVKLPDTGVVNTFSISYIKWDATRVKEPTIPAVIEIDGAAPLTVAAQLAAILHIPPIHTIDFDLLGRVRPRTNLPS